MIPTVVSLYKQPTSAQTSLLTEGHRHRFRKEEKFLTQTKMIKIKHLGVLFGLLHIIYAVPSILHTTIIWLLMQFVPCRL